MSGIKAGDRVHVEFDGEVDIANPGADDTLRVKITEVGWEAFVWLRPKHCTVIVPPVKVGDTVTADNIGQLPNGSIVARPGETPIWTWDDNWFQWDVAAPSSRDVALGATVLRIGGAS